MKKSSKKILWITLPILLILLVAGLGIYYYTPQNVALGGSTVLSISNVQVQDQGAKILVTVIPRGNTDIEIDFTPSTLNSFLQSQGYQATKSSILKTSYVESTKKFYFTPTTNNYVKVLRSTNLGNYDKGIVGTTSSAIINYCRNSYANTLTAYWTDIGLFSINDLNCVDYTNSGYVTSFNTGLGTDGFKVLFNLDGEQKYVTGDEQFITMANGQAEISWVGSLLGINSLSAPNYDVYHVGSDWYLVDKNAYTNVNNGVNTFINCMGSIDWLANRPTGDDYSRCRSNYETLLIQNIVSKNYKYISEVSNAESISFSQGVMEVNLKQPTTLPTFTIELDASRVGLIKLAGTPEIVNCIPKETFESAGTKSVSATIKNTGTSEGYFDFQITCNNNLISGHSDSLNFGAGQTNIVNFQIYGGNTGTTTNSGTCTLKVTDRTSQKSVSCNYQVDVAYNPAVGECTGAETQCSGDFQSIFKCENNKFVQSTCKTPTTDKCAYVNSIAQCINSSSGGGTGEYCASCWAWAGNIFKPEAEKCEADATFKPTATWNPLTWIPYLGTTAINATGITSQNILCPIFFLVMGLFLVIILFILMIVLLGFAGVALLFKKLFKKR